MQSGNEKKSRSKIEEYLDAALAEPVRMTRRDGESFILMSEKLYDNFRNEIQSLQRRLIGMCEIADDRTKPYVRGEERTTRFKK